MSWFAREVPRDPPKGLASSAIPWIDDFRAWHHDDEKVIGKKTEWDAYVAMCTIVYSQLAKSLLERTGHPAGVERLDAFLKPSAKQTIDYVALLNFISEHFTDQWRTDAAPHARQMIPIIARGFA